METDRELLKRMVRRALCGEGAHVEVKKAFEGLNWKLASVGSKNGHSISQVLNHMIFWNQWAVKWLAGKNPAIPNHAAGSWPGKPAPGTSAEWRGAVQRFDRGLREMVRVAQRTDLFTRKGNKTNLEMFQTIASHNSYHVGQVVALRRQLGAWPPPSGGLTW
jgi:uncharacterized damage-inducible protein DinB